MTDTTRSLRARIAAHKRLASMTDEERRGMTAAATKARESSFKNEHERKAYYLNLALMGLEARRRKGRAA